MGSALDEYLFRVHRFGFEGSVLVASHGQVLVDKGYGYADHLTHEWFTGGTLVDIASISKQFTAAGVLALEMDGRLRVEDPLGRFFPSAPPDKAAITLHQLLTHTSGLIDEVGPEYQPVGRDEFLRQEFATPLLFHPGARFRYANSGYSVLAAVIEKVSGEPLGEFLRHRLFLPAGMAHTGFRLPMWDRQRLAAGWSLDGPWGTPLEHPWAKDGPYWYLRGNGGILSTVDDLYLWHLALADNTVLSQAEGRKLVTPFAREGHTDSRYGYGWSMNTAPDGSRMASHTGGNGVFWTDFIRYLDAQAVIIAGSNRTDYSAVDVSAHLENRLFGQPDPDPPVVRELPPEDVVRCAGGYQLPNGESLLAVVKSGGLNVVPQGGAGLSLLAANQAQGWVRRMTEKTDQVQAALRAARPDALDPLDNLFGETAKVESQPFHQAVVRFEHELGPLTGGSVWGTAMLNGYSFTYVVFHFSHGSRLVEFRWAGPALEAVRYPPQPQGRLYLGDEKSATAPSTEIPFAAYDIKTGETQRMRCVLSGRSGPALSLVFQAGGHDVAALRSGG
jgi:CubicO group peptidase (beta-lactamase class C family)